MKFRFGFEQKYYPELKKYGFLGRIINLFIGLTAFGSYIRGLYFKKLIIEFFKNSKINVLDVGYSRGLYSIFLAKNFSNFNIDAIEIDREKIVICDFIKSQEKINNLNLFEKDIFLFNPKKKYDLIYSIDVLEHIKDNKKVIEIMTNLLNDKGLLIIHMPNKIQKRILSKKIFDKFNMWEKKEHVGAHYNLNELKKEILKNNLKIIYAKNTFGFFGSISWEMSILFNEYLKLPMLYILVLPMLKLIGKLDILVNYSHGNGILIVAKKELK